MGCGIADFGRRGLKTPQTQDFWVFILSPGTSTRGATWDLDSRRQGPRLAAQGTSTRGAGDLDSRRQGTSTRKVTLGAIVRGIVICARHCKLCAAL